MNKIKLGLDVGTNSIGWAVLEKHDRKYEFLQKEDKDGNIMPSKGSYIFSKGADANENSKAAERRGFRGARRRIDRIRLRKIATLKVLEEFDLCPNFNSGELNRWKNKKEYPCGNDSFIDWQRTGKKNGNSETEKLKQPYYLRHLAATEEGMMETPQGKLQLGRAFYHISQRRGYYSNSDEDQTEDKLDLFKTDVSKLLENCYDSGSFLEPFEVIFDLYKGDDKVKRLSTKIKKELKNEIEFEKIKILIIEEFEKPENLGKVMTAIGELSKEMEKHPTMGSYFFSIYNKTNIDSGLKNKIRGRYTHREFHYESEFNYICDKQKIKGELRDKLYTAIFYQRPLKSQKGLVATCPLDTKRKRIAISHPLFEEFRLLESINRIKIKRQGETKLDFLNTDEKELIKNDFLQKTDFEFNKIAKKLSQGNSYRYSKDKKILQADVEFNFPMDKKFSACPTISSLRKIIGIESYNKLALLNTGYNDEKGKKQISIEDVWHCLFMDSFGGKDKKTVRKEFAEKHLLLDDKGIEDFQKIKLIKGYGSLSKSAIKKILPFLKEGEIYTNAVFLANIIEVLGRKISNQEQQIITGRIKSALETHNFEKQNVGIVNNYISKFKDNKDSLGDNSFSIESHKNGLDNEMKEWIGELQLNKFEKEELLNITSRCWLLFSEAVYDKVPKDISFLSTKTVPEFVFEALTIAFPNDKIDVTKLYHPSAMETYKQADKKLGNPEISSIKNPVFNRAMHQIKRLVNELIRKGLVDKDTEVNVEVAGEINSASYRRALTIWQKEQETIRTWAKNEIIETYSKECRGGINPTDNDIVKYILYREQNRRCLYTADTISICDFLGNQAVYDIEHTIPRSKYHDNSMTNLTLANSDFNRNYKKDILPALLKVNFKSNHINKESVLLNRDFNLRSYSLKNNIPNWNITLYGLKADYDKYKNAAKAISDPMAHEEVMTKAHYTKFKLDYLKDKYKNFEREEITSQFTNANLVDTRIIAKYSRAYLNSYFKKVNVVKGKVTDTLRKMWGLQSEYEVKDRSNHIHHCIDAITVACVERNIVNWISEAYHKYESDYFRGNSKAKVDLKEPMIDFTKRMKNLHKEVLIFHKQNDRIKPLLEQAQKENSKKMNLRGKLNSQNPYAHIKKNDEMIFAQRKPISKISGADIENIIDEGIKKRLLALADFKGWQNTMEFQFKEDESKNDAEMQHKKMVAYRLYEKLKKAKNNHSVISHNITKEIISHNFDDANSLILTLFETSVNVGLDVKKKENYRTKVNDEVFSLVRTKGLELLLKEANGVIILPQYEDYKNGKTIGRMVIKRLRIKSSQSNLKDYKEIRKIDQSKYEHKQDYYFDKESNTNYEGRIYGDLIPEEKGRFTNRKYKVINHYNIVKKVFDLENEKPLLKLHTDDVFLVFDQNPNEINWGDPKDLQNRLFKIVKFDENGIIVLERHSYALGNVDKVAKENCIESGCEKNQLSDLSRVVLRRSPSTLRIIPTKVDTLGRIDIEYSRGFINLHRK